MDNFILQNTADILPITEVTTAGEGIGFLRIADYSWRIKRLYPDSKLPTKAHSTDLGYDLYCVGQYTLMPGKITLLTTGIACNFPPGFGGLIRDRSSIATQRGVIVVAGVIDPEYIGEIKVALLNTTQKTVMIDNREKIAQLLLTPVVNASSIKEVSELHKTIRGEKGFGSSD